MGSVVKAEQSMLAELFMPWAWSSLKPPWKTAGYRRFA